MKRVLALVEGRTEELFIKNVLDPHLLHYGKKLIPTLVNTRPSGSGSHTKGGGDFGKLKNDMLQLLNDRNAVAITMFYDYYEFPDNFPPGFPLRSVTKGQKHDGADQLEQALSAYFKHRRFHPYVHLHEFEAFLFVDARITATKLLRPDIEPDIAKVRAAYANAEAINDSRTTAPSKRIKIFAKTYNKIAQGAIIAEDVGLPALRADCPRFNQWVSWLEQL